MKTILIPIFHPLDARNILRTKVLSNLTDGGLCRVILLVPISKELYYKNNFESPEVVVESVSPLAENRVAKILRLSARMMLNTGSMYWQAKIRFANTGERGRYYYDRLMSLLGRFSFIRSLTRLSFSFLAYNRDFKGVFRKYSPNLVFLTDIYSPENVYLGLEARHHNVDVVGLVRSWDNITSKGTCLFVPDHLIVHNEELKERAVNILGVEEKNISVTGLPHFDYYKDYIPTPRSLFLSRLGLPPDSRYILFAPYLGTYKPAVNEILQILDKAIADGHLPSDLKVVVRMPPSYNARFQDVWTSDRIIVDYPGEKLSGSGKSDWEFSEADMIHLADSIMHSAVVLNFASTITVDAAALDRPVINLGFDGFGPKDFAGSISSVYMVDHFHSVIASDGTPLVKNDNELLQTINTYLDDPSLHAEGRRIIVKDQCGVVDGQAGERTAGLIIDQINSRL